LAEELGAFFDVGEHGGGFRGLGIAEDFFDGGLDGDGFLEAGGVGAGDGVGVLDDGVRGELAARRTGDGQDIGRRGRRAGGGGQKPCDVVEKIGIGGRTAGHFQQGGQGLLVEAALPDGCGGEEELVGGNGRRGVRRVNPAGDFVEEAGI